MNTRISTLVTMTLLLGACDLAEDDFDTLDSELELDEAEDAAEPATPASAADGLAAPGSDAPAPHGGVPDIAGLDECYVMRAPVIARIDRDLSPTCAFAEMPQDWEGTFLIDASPWLAELLDQAPLPSGSPLLDYCKYEYSGDDDLATAYSAFFNSAAGESAVDAATMATDCPVMTEQGTGLANGDMTAVNHETYRDSVDALTDAQLGYASNHSARLYLLDTAQQGQSAVSNHSAMASTWSASGWPPLMRPTNTSLMRWLKSAMSPSQWNGSVPRIPKCRG